MSFNLKNVILIHNKYSLLFCDNFSIYNFTETNLMIANFKMIDLR